MDRTWFDLIFCSTFKVSQLENNWWDWCWLKCWWNGSHHHYPTSPLLWQTVFFSPSMIRGKNNKMPLPVFQKQDLFPTVRPQLWSKISPSAPSLPISWIQPAILLRAMCILLPAGGVFSHLIPIWFPPSVSAVEKWTGDTADPYLWRGNICPTCLKEVTVNYNNIILKGNNSLSSSLSCCHLHCSNHKWASSIGWLDSKGQGSNKVNNYRFVDIVSSYLHQVFHELTTVHWKEWWNLDLYRWNDIIWSSLSVTP